MVRAMAFRPLMLLLFLMISRGTWLSAQEAMMLEEDAFEMTCFPPDRIVKLGSGHYFIDFGKAYFGTVMMKAKQDIDQPFTLHLGEKESEGNRVCRAPGGSIRYQKVTVNGLADKIWERAPLRPDERNTGDRAIALPDSFGVIMPFRFCEITDLPVPIDQIEIRQRAYHYRFNDKASRFSSSDTILNQIWDLCKHTIKATSFAGYYIDGDRERIPYEADAFINQLSHYCVDSVYSIARRTNLYFLDHPTWPTEWILHIVPLFYYDFLYTGETELLKKNYDALKVRTLMDLEGPEGLISSASERLTPSLMRELGFTDTLTRLRDIVDWPPGQKDTNWKLATEEGERDGYEMVPYNTVVNAFYYRNLLLVSRIAKVLGFEEDYRFYEKKAAKVKEAMNRLLVDNNRGVFVDGIGSDHASLHANMFPLAFGLVPDHLAGSVIDHMKSRGMVCSVYGAQYLLEGLALNGETANVLELMTNTAGDRNWWNMIKSGSTMTMEAWDIRYKPNMDWNHAWGTVPANIITRYIWGIRPDEPGFTSAIIQPQLSGLTQSDIRVPTIQGAIHAEYMKLDRVEHYLIELPNGMTGTFFLPDGMYRVTLNGSPVSSPDKQIQLGQGDHRIEITQIPQARH